MTDMERKSPATPRYVHVGIDAGSVSLNCVAVSPDREIVYEFPYRRHMGKVEEETLDLMGALYGMFGRDRILSVSFTGNNGEHLSRKLGTLYEFETITQVLGAMHLVPGVRSVISMGGQETALLQIAHFEGDASGEPGGWELEYFNTNGPCASGTGSFIEQQAERLATALYREHVDASARDMDGILADFISLGLTSTTPAHVACRCTVFTKSDMIHLQNKGEKLADIIHGLHVGNARNYMSTIVSRRVLEDPIVFLGGLSLNELQVRSFKPYFPNLIVPPHATSAGALGVALQALEAGRRDRIDPEGLVGDHRPAGDVKVPSAPALRLRRTVFSPASDVRTGPRRKREPVFLGIDIGSTTTKHVLMNEQREIIHKDYVHTQGKPVEVTQGLLGRIARDLGDSVEIVGTATTGSGRNVVGEFLDVDLIIDEITAHARGAVEIDPEVGTIFEIGGQDSKYISISNAYPLDFDMNKVCAAGTGSFLHELANKYGINIVGEFETIALSSPSPVKLAERCTVFMESDLVSYLQKGVPAEDLVAGLCYAVVHNYLNRVVGKRTIGERVMFLGGPSLNKAVVAAFENVLGRGLIVPPHREVLGAYGAALAVQETMGMEEARPSSFRGIESAVADRMDYTEKVCRADPQCHNRCKLKIYDFDGRRSVWGGECGRYELTRGTGTGGENYFELRDRLWREAMEGVCVELGDEPLMEVDGRPTVGMQRALYGLHSGIFWSHFFDRLGFRLVLTPPTNAHLSGTGIEATVAETCYPVKVSHGHVKELLGMTRHLFLPTMVTMPVSHDGETGFYCPMVQSNSFMVRAALGIDSTGVIAPTVHRKYDLDRLALELGGRLRGVTGAGKREVRAALAHAVEMEERFEQELYRRGREVLAGMPPSDPLVVVTGRPYNLYDERLNLRLGRNLAKIGVTALPMDFIEVSGVSLEDFPSMYWGIGARILRTAKVILGRSNYFGLHLTNFGCGADSFIEHFYRHLMGGRPYLILELDEHSAVAGVMTRLEAFKNVLINSMRRSRARELEDGMKLAN